VNGGLDYFTPARNHIGRAGVRGRYSKFDILNKLRQTPNPVLTNPLIALPSLARLALAGLAAMPG